MVRNRPTWKLSGLTPTWHIHTTIEESCYIKKVMWVEQGAAYLDSLPVGRSPH